MCEPVVCGEWSFPHLGLLFIILPPLPPPPHVQWAHCNSLNTPPHPPPKRIGVRFTLWSSQHPRKGSVFRNGKYQHLLFGWQMSSLPSWPPSLAYLLVGGVQIHTALCDAWKYSGNQLNPASLCTLTSKSLSEVRDRWATASRLSS